MIDPANLKPSLVAATTEHAPWGFEQHRREHIVPEVTAAFLNALLADDEAMLRGVEAFLADDHRPDGFVADLRAAIIAAVTEEP